MAEETADSSDPLDGRPAVLVGSDLVRLRCFGFVLEGIQRARWRYGGQIDLTFSDATRVDVAGPTLVLEYNRSPKARLVYLHPDRGYWQSSSIPDDDDPEWDQQVHFLALQVAQWLGSLPEEDLSASDLSRAAVERFLGWFADHLLYHGAVKRYIADLESALQDTKEELTEAGIRLRIEKARYDQLEKLYEGLKLELSKGEPDKRIARQIIGAIALATGGFVAGIGGTVGGDYLTDLRKEQFPVASAEEVQQQCDVTVNLLEEK